METRYATYEFGVDRYRLGMSGRDDRRSLGGWCRGNLIVCVGIDPVKRPVQGILKFGSFA
ncbi:hypothetical protein [Mycobacterium sp. 23]|uniref:hypothetical protein n=1 Tax=Mycobacterium sp. 23 TaxID=3400424 RepID=UPI003AAE1FD6